MMDEMRRMNLYCITFLMTVIANLNVVQSHACNFEKRPDPSRGGELRWSLPRSEVCYCQAVVAPRYSSSCPRNDDYEKGDLWFVDDLRLLYQLTLRRNWQKEILDELLQRNDNCDINECATNTDNCHDNAECNNTFGNFSCACNDGYSGDGVSCEDINECASDSDNCHDNAECSNYVGSFNCTCNAGYSGDGVSCEDINECTANQDKCHDRAECSNIIGSFSCACQDGYSGDGVSCDDINECASDSDNCHDNAECSNSIGSYNCTCNEGYSGEGVSCEDINECTANQDNCHDKAECSNINGSFTCACQDGYSGDGVSCGDINECATDSDNCHNNAGCSNNIGSFICTCNDGYYGDGMSCEDIAACYEYMGVANGDIPDANIQASSRRLDKYEAYNGRLNASTFWRPSLQDDVPWIQVDFGYQTYISGVVTQGEGEYVVDDGYWVAKFKVSTFFNFNSTERFVLNGNQTKIFAGNVDDISLKTSYFPELVYAQIVRITCLEKGGGNGDPFAMRFEILGCKND